MGSYREKKKKKKTLMGFGFCSSALCKEEISGEKPATVKSHKSGATWKQQNMALMTLLMDGSKVKAQWDWYCSKWSYDSLKYLPVAAN